MNRINQRLAAAFIALSVFTLAGCNSTQINDATSKIQSQGTPILTNLSEQAQQLGEKAKSSADNAMNMATDFINNIKGTNPLDTKAFESGWTNLKNELQTMADNATSVETTAKINELKASLEVQFNDINTRINANGNVSEIKTSIANFWTEARTKIGELTK